VKFEMPKNFQTLKTRTMSKVKALSFAGNTIYCGLDVHKTNWKINCRMEGMEIASFSQNADTALLKRYMSKNYPGAKIKVAYEAGFSGFAIQRSLTELGIECIIVNAADVPTTDKERKRKDDKRDARKLSRELADGDLEAIYVPQPSMEHARSLVRQRHRLAQDQTRCKNRIKHLLMFSGLKTQSGQERWTQRYVKELLDLDCGTETLKSALCLAVEQYQHIRKLLKEATVLIKNLSRQEPFATVQKYLQSIDGIGIVNGMVIQTELQDIYRFKTLDSLCDYAGFVPDISSSNDNTKIKGITHRCNEFLREAIIESSWMLIRKDPAMLMKYNEYRRRMKENKAIIRIGKHLLSRIRHVWKNEIEYQRGVVA
jgi:transposase